MTDTQPPVTDQPSGDAAEDRSLALAIADILSDTPAADTLVLDISAVSSFADFFVICSGENERQVRGIAAAVRDRTAEAGILPRRVEGEAASGWILIDYAHVIVHIFEASQRSFYQLESLWDQAPTILSIQ